MQVPVDHHVAAGGERGPHHLGDVLGPVGGVEQRLGPGVEVDGRRVEQHGADGGADGGGPGLEREERAVAEPLGEPPRLGALAGALAALEGDQHRLTRRRRRGRGGPARRLVPLGPERERGEHGGDEDDQATPATA